MLAHMEMHDHSCTVPSWHRASVWEKALSDVRCERYNMAMSQAADEVVFHDGDNWDRDWLNILVQTRAPALSKEAWPP